MQLLSEGDVTDAILAASRALVAVAARSLAAVQDEVTLPQYRLLVVLCEHGPTTMGRLAEELGSAAPTATRLCDRLVLRGLVERTHRPDNRREVQVQATREGRELVASVTERRRSEIDRIVGAIPQRQRAALVTALRTFSDAAGEVPDQAWATGWDL